MGWRVGGPGRLTSETLSDPTNRRARGGRSFPSQVRLPQPQSRLRPQQHSGTNLSLVILIISRHRATHILPFHSCWPANKHCCFIPRAVRPVSTRLRGRSSAATTSATTAHSKNMATQHSLHNTPSRRALGDLTPNCIHSPTTQTRNADPSEAIRPRSPLKKVTSHIPSVFADKENLLAPNALPQGKKRGIEEVEDVERPGYAKMLAGGRDESLWDSGMRLTATAIQRHTVHCIRSLTHPQSTDTK